MVPLKNYITKKTVCETIDKHQISCLCYGVLLGPCSEVQVCTLQSTLVIVSSHVQAKKAVKTAVSDMVCSTFSA